jgi:transposase
LRHNQLGAAQDHGQLVIEIMEWRWGRSKPDRTGRVILRERTETAGHPFYEQLNRVLDEAKFDTYCEERCRRFYHAKVGRPSLAPGVYFRLLLIGFFEGIGSERGIGWRVADSLSLRRFLSYWLDEATPDHVTISRTRRLLDEATHQAVFTFVLGEVVRRGMLKGKTIGIDATTLEANAAMRSIVRREYLRRLATETGIDSTDDAAVRRMDRKRKKAGFAVADQIATPTAKGQYKVYEQGMCEVVTDKGYHSGASLEAMREMGMRSYVSVPQEPRRNWKGKAEQQAVVYANQRRVEGERGKRLLRRRGEFLESLNLSLRKVIKTRGSFPNQEAAMKLLSWPWSASRKSGPCRSKTGRPPYSVSRFCSAPAFQKRSRRKSPGEEEIGTRTFPGWGSAPNPEILRFRARIPGPGGETRSLSRNPGP